MIDQYAHISYGVEDRVATVTLARPEARNGYTVRMSNELEDALQQADADDEVRVVILTGAGTDFCVGADLSEGSFEAVAEDVDAPSWQEPAGRCSRQIFMMQKPVIAAVRGVAVGAGSTIILSCDFRLAATDARFGFVFTRRGIFPEGGSAWYLPQIVGMGVAMDWMLTGRVFDAEEARASGLVRSLHAPEALLPAARALALDLITHTAPVSVAVTRQMLHRLAPLLTPDEAHAVDSRLVAGIADHADAYEGVASFLERRPPKFPLTEADVPTWLPWPAAPRR